MAQYLDQRVTALELAVLELEGGQLELYAEDLTGTQDGVNLTLQCSRQPGAIVLVHRNGLLQREGPGEAYTRSGRFFTFTRAPKAWEWFRVVMTVASGVPAATGDLGYVCP